MSSGYSPAVDRTQEAVPSDGDGEQSIQCQACSTPVFSSARFCPSCGVRLTRRVELSDSVRPQGDLDSLRSALGLLRAKQWPDAAAILEELVERWPEWPVARAYLGTALLHCGRAADSRVELEQAVAEAPESFICLVQYAEFLGTLGFFDQAAVQLRAALDQEAPDARSREAAVELFRHCRDSAKGIFYRPTAFPRLPNLGRLFFGRRQGARVSAGAVGSEKE